MKIIVTVMHWLMLSCKRATQLMEKKMHFGLNPVEKMQLKLHKKACKFCTAYEKQNEIIDKVLQEGMAEHIQGHNLSEEEKERMMETVRKSDSISHS